MCYNCNVISILIDGEYGSLIILLSLSLFKGSPSDMDVVNIYYNFIKMLQ